MLKREIEYTDLLGADGKHYYRFCSDEVIANCFLKDKSTEYVTGKAVSDHAAGRPPLPPCPFGYYHNEYMSRYKNPNDDLPF